jgi:hypothetical protein
MRRRCEAVVAARGGHTRYWTPQTSILHDNFCLSMICSDNDVEKFCWYCLICYAHMNLNYTIFVDFFFSMEKILSIKPLYRFFCWLVYISLNQLTHLKGNLAWIFLGMVFNNRFIYCVNRKSKMATTAKLVSLA